MRRFVRAIEPLLARPVRILDIGGTPDYWRALPALYGLRNVEITIVNLGSQEFDESNLKVRHGDARSLDFPDAAFEVVHSNSVIEHVGHWPDMVAMAAEVRRLAPTYFVQTPNYWFPLEPHYRLPLVQFLPERQRASLIHVLRRNPTSRSALEIVRQTRLLSARQMRRLFPDARIERERFAGLTKSLIAIRSS